MKGIVFHMLEHAVTTAYGEAAWDELLGQVGVSGAYTSLGSYDDAELACLVAAASRLTGDSEEGTIRWFARTATPLLIERYPAFFAPHRSLWTLLPTLNDVIHPEVRKIYPGAIAPDFRFEKTAEGHLLLEYSSPRKLCSFAEGLIEGSAQHFGETVRISQPRCARRGDPSCHLVCAIERRG